jgi:hypothetical protein
MICSGDTTTEDPSGSDSTDPLLLTLDGLDATEVGLQGDWQVLQTRGYPQMPPRKGHAIMLLGCGSDAPGPDIANLMSGLDDGSSTKTISECAMYSFGGWNPRWSEGITGAQGLMKLSLDTKAWSMIPSDADLVRLTDACVQAGACRLASHPDCKNATPMLCVLAFSILCAASSSMNAGAHSCSRPSVVRSAGATDSSLCSADSVLFGNASTHPAWQQKDCCLPAAVAGDWPSTGRCVASFLTCV